MTERAEDDVSLEPAAPLPVATVRAGAEHWKPIPAPAAPYVRGPPPTFTAVQVLVVVAIFVVALAVVVAMSV